MNPLEFRQYSLERRLMRKTVSLNKYNKLNNNLRRLGILLIYLSSSSNLIEMTERESLIDGLVVTQLISNHILNIMIPIMMFLVKMKVMVMGLRDPVIIEGVDHPAVLLHIIEEVDIINALIETTMNAVIERDTDHLVQDHLIGTIVTVEIMRGDIIKSLINIIIVAIEKDAVIAVRMKEEIIKRSIITVDTMIERIVIEEIEKTKKDPRIGHLLKTLKTPPTTSKSIKTNKNEKNGK